MPKPPVGAPWAPAPYENADIGAVKAWAKGDASPEQQQRAFRWVIEIACRTYDQSYRPDSARDSDFAEGKRFVGNSIIKLTKLLRNDDDGRANKRVSTRRNSRKRPAG